MALFEGAQFVRELALEVVALLQQQQKDLAQQRQLLEAQSKKMDAQSKEMDAQSKQIAGLKQELDVLRAHSPIAKMFGSLVSR